ncbi:MAG: hypothetical protein HFE63_04860 [Clostridiales bacterium]|nr:hypothetical protein [Clostridiales bacterium]
MNHPTIKYLQEYLKSKDFQDGDPQPYFLKLVEEVGELSHAIFMGAPHASDDNIKGSIEEELWDVMYYTLCIANEYGIDMEKWIKMKEDYNNKRYNSGAKYDPQ